MNPPFKNFLDFYVKFIVNATEANIPTGLR
jgi:hypothetical protein